MNKIRLFIVYPNNVHDVVVCHSKEKTVKGRQEAGLVHDLGLGSDHMLERYYGELGVSAAQSFAKLMDFSRTGDDEDRTKIDIDALIFHKLENQEEDHRGNDTELPTKNVFSVASQEMGELALSKLVFGEREPKALVAADGRVARGYAQSLIAKSVQYYFKQLKADDNTITRAEGLARDKFVEFCIHVLDPRKQEITGEDFKNGLLAQFDTKLVTLVKATRGLYADQDEEEEEQDA